MCSASSPLLQRLLRHHAMHPCLTSDRRCILSKLRYTWSHLDQTLEGMGHRGGIPHMRRKVESVPKGSPVDAHERTRDYLSEEEFAVLLQGTPRSRYR